MAYQPNTTYHGPEAGSIFHPYGVGDRVRFYLYNGEGEEVDRCGVRNVPEAIEATYKELLKQNNGDETFSFSLGEKISL